MSGQAGHHVALGVEHEDAIVAADIASMIRCSMVCVLPPPTLPRIRKCRVSRSRPSAIERQQLDAVPVNPALAGAGPREGFQPCRAAVQPRAARDLEGRPVDAKAESEAEQRQEADHGRHWRRRCSEDRTHRARRTRRADAGSVPIISRHRDRRRARVLAP